MKELFVVPQLVTGFVAASLTLGLVAGPTFAETSQGSGAQTLTTTATDAAALAQAQAAERRAAEAAAAEKARKEAEAKAKAKAKAKAEAKRKAKERKRKLAAQRAARAAARLANDMTGVHRSAYTGKYYDARYESTRKCIVKRESMGYYRVVSSNGAWHGAYQFTIGTAAEAARRMGRPDLAGTSPARWNRAEQDEAFWTMWNHGRGSGHWRGGRYSCGF